MLYKYDNAIVDDLKRSFNPENVPNPVVSVISPDQIVGVAAQIQNDSIKLPIIALTRNQEQIDSTRTNFTAMHRGVATVIDNATNELYHEKVIPITLSYNLTIITSNTADMDEMIRELMFKYINMYFLTIKLPYESNRKIRFGVSLSKDSEIDRTSGVSEYRSEGKLYQSILTLNCEGAVLVSYTPVKLKRLEYEIDPISK